MALNLVIVESPAKCGKLTQFLGKDFRVVASMGHFRDLPPKGMGVDLSTMEPSYVISKEDVVKRLVADAKKANVIYLCTDPDREGEAISWHLKNVLPQDKEFRRATFQEITKKAVVAAVANYGQINEDLANAQQARRILDRVVGYKLSPELWKVFSGKRGLSAGRVQSVATRLVVEREREIRDFKEEISYKLISFHTKNEVPFKAELKFQIEQGKKKTLKFKKEEIAKDLQAELKDADFIVHSVVHKEQNKKPQAPFTTPNMQAKAANVLKMSAAKSMQVAQKLYEGGHITYHRTDSVAISDDSLKSLRNFIKGKYGENYLPGRAHNYSSKSGSQEAHECIRPTHVENESPPSLSRDELSLYHLIRNQFISCQMASGKDALSVVTLDAKGYFFEARGRVELFDGYRLLNRTEVQEKSRTKKEKEDQENQKLPPLEKDEVLKADRLDLKQVKTKPPGRYSEASLIKKLEKEGIGRPSTYTSIVGTIVNRGYVTLEKRKYYAEELGEQVTDFLVNNFPRILDVSFTRRCEDRLDAIGDGTMDFKEFLMKFWAYLRKQINSRSYVPPVINAAPVEPKIEEPSKKRVAKKKPATAAKKVSKKSNNSGQSKSTEPVSEKTASKKTPPKCPACSKATKLEESRKWPGRYFYCCHPCKSYLESDKKGLVAANKKWLRA
ncbi:MAG: type I DNA topoisomerase [Planctomycetes bacterium]|nr:type I DNA topoisomerase [Planctomycetota bacterium]